MTRARIVTALLGASLAASLVAALTASEQQTPPVQEAAPGQFVWHDLVTHDPTGSRAFYGALFGWTFAASDGIDPGYTLIKNGKRPIGGIVTRRAGSGNDRAEWLAYVVVADVDRTARAFREKGGRIYRGPLNARKDLRVAAVADPQGAALGLASRGPAFATSDTDLHNWLWMEYVARDPEGALAFYADTLGFRHEIAETLKDFTYYLLSTDRPRAGLFRSVWKDEASAWLPYIRVADPEAMAARVTELGGAVLIPPSARVRNRTLTIVADPSGAVMALQKFPFDRGVRP